jgi:uncharacterized protein
VSDVRYYLDANIVIYLIQQPPGWGPRAATYVTALQARGDRVVVSDLTRLECRVGPLAAGDGVLLGQFDSFFRSANVETVGLTAAVCDRTALIRATMRFKLGDALHLGAAVVHGCDRFVTHDRRLHAFRDITVELLL